MRSMGNTLAALLLGLGLLGGGALTAQAATVPSGAPTALRAAIQSAQATPGAGTATADGQCQDDEEGESGENEQEDQAEGDAEDDADNVEEENGADDATEGDTDDAAEDDTEDDEEQEVENLQPGTLTEGQDLEPQAKVTVEQAVKTAQGAATGDLGTVELEQKGGTLVFEVTIGDQEVFVDATTGAVVSVAPVQDQEDECEDEETAAAPGTLDDGKELLFQATITVEAAIASAQGAATGEVGEVDLEEVDGVLVFNVDIGDKDVKVDAASGRVLAVDEDD